VQTEQEAIVKEKTKSKIESIEEATSAFCKKQIELIISEVDKTLNKVKEQ